MNTQIIKSALVASLIGIASVAAEASTQSFDFKDPKGVNNVQFKLDAPLESITGTGTGISGTVDFDPAKPSLVSGTISLDASSLTVGNPKMMEHLHGAYWLDVAKYPTIDFVAKSVAHAKTVGNKTTADITGILTVKGISKEITIPATFTYLEDKLGARLGDDKVKGDLLVLRTDFTIDREDFGIQVGEYKDKVSETINLSFSIAGASPQS